MVPVDVTLSIKYIKNTWIFWGLAHRTSHNPLVFSWRHRNLLSVLCDVRELCIIGGCHTLALLKRSHIAGSILGICSVWKQLARNPATVSLLSNVHPRTSTNSFFTYNTHAQCQIAICFIFACICSRSFICTPRINESTIDYVHTHFFSIKQI